MGAALVGAGDVEEETPNPRVYGEGNAPSPGLRRSPLELSSPGRPWFVLACWPRAVTVVVVPVAERTLPAVPPLNAAGAVGSAQNMPGPTPASTEAGLGGLAGTMPPPPPEIDEEKDALPRSGVVEGPGKTLDCEVDGGGASWGEMVPPLAGSRRIVVEVFESPFLCFK